MPARVSSRLHDQLGHEIPTFIKHGTVFSEYHTNLVSQIFLMKTALMEKFLQIKSSMSEFN